MLKSLAKGRSKKVECCNVTGSMAAMKAWRSVQRRARDLLRRNSHSQLVESFEVHAILLYAYEFPHYIPIIVKTTPCHSKWETCTGFRIGTFKGSGNRETLQTLLTEQSKTCYLIQLLMHEHMDVTKWWCNLDIKIHGLIVRFSLVYA